MRSILFTASLALSAALLANTRFANAAAIMYISNFGSSSNSPLAYDTSTHVLTGIDNKLGISGTFVAPAHSTPASLELYAVQDNSGAGTSALLAYSFNPLTNTYGSATTFVSGMAHDSRGMAYSSLNNKIYLTTTTGSGGEVRQITASGVGAGTQGTPIVFNSGNARPFGIAVDSTGATPVLWVVTYTGTVAELFKYDVATSSATSVYQSASGLFVRDAIAPANFAGGTYTGDIFFTNLLTNTVEYFNPVTLTHGVLANTGTNLLNLAAGIGFDPADGSLYVSNAGLSILGDSTVVKYNVGTSTFQYATNLGPGNGVLNGPNDLSFFVVAAPEPTSLTLFGTGAMLLIGRRRR